MAVPYAFANKTSAIPLSELDINFATPITIGESQVQLGGNVSFISSVDLSNSFVIATGATIPRTLAAYAADTINVKDFGAVGDGITDDTAAIQAAVNSLTHGGVVTLPPTGAPYLISGTISLGNGVILQGSAAKNFAGVTATNTQWASRGAWINPTGGVGTPAIRCVGHGSGVIGINFIHNQSAPAVGWAPTQYGYCIEIKTSFITISDIVIVNASHGIHINYTEASGGGTSVNLSNIIISAFVVRLKTTRANDTMYFQNIHCRNLWYASNSYVVQYIRANTIGWYCGYTDNVIVNGMEFFEESIAIYLENETCLGNTHSLYNATLNNIQFNLPTVCMKVASSTTSAIAYFSNVVSQTGNAFGLTWGDTAFQLGSDNIKIEFSGLSVPECGGVFMDIGNGIGGSVRIAGLTVENYSTVSSGQSCFQIFAGAELKLSNYEVVKHSGNGYRFAGAGLNNLITSAYNESRFFTDFNAVTITGDGTYQSMGTDSFYRMGQGGATQARLTGEIYVSVASPGTSMTLRASGIISISVTINTSSVAWVSFDSGWIDIEQSVLNAQSTVGRIEANPATGVTIDNGGTSVLYK